jgi:hypothetical protein
MRKKAIVALELRHDEKIIGGKITKKQAIYIFPTAIFCYGLFYIPLNVWLAPFVGKSLSNVLRFGIEGFITIVIMSTALILAFIPAHFVPWLKDPKPTINQDPYDREMMLDDYLMLKLHNAHKEKVLSWRGGRM